MKKKYFIGVTVISIIGLVTVLLYFQTRPRGKEVHYHAGFQVYVNSKLQDFSDYKYMSVSPCVDDDSYSKRKVDEQNEKAHLHDGNGDVVHTHIEGGTWGDLFKNLKYPIDDRKMDSAYINGTEVENILSYPIKPFDSVSIFMGKKPTNMQSHLAKRVANDRIREVEKMSEACGIKED